MPVLFRHSSETAMFNRFLKVAIATSSFMNAVCSVGFLPEFSVSVLRQIIALNWDYVYETRKWKVTLAEKYKWNWNMKSFFMETLNFLFRKFWASYVLDLAQTMWALQILSQKFSLNFWVKELWTLENHVIVNVTLLKLFHRGTLSIHWYIAQNFQPTFSNSVLFRRSSKTAMFSRFLKIAIATSSFMNEVCNGGFSPWFSFKSLN